MECKQFNNSVLLIDDDTQYLSMLENILGDFYKKIYSYDNPLKALDDFLNDRVEVDAIITDLRMPKLNGVEFCDLVRKKNKDIPILIISSHSDSSDLIKLIKLNLVDYVLKPLTQEKLENAVFQINEKIKKKNKIYFKEFFYDYDNRTLTFYDDEKVIEFSDKEYLLFELLLKHQNMLVSKDLIELNIYNQDIMTDNAYRNLVWRLRSKLPQNTLKTIKNLGIKLQIDEE